MGQRERDHTKSTHYQRQRFEAKRTSTTLSLNPTALRTNLMERPLLHSYPLWLVNKRSANSHPRDRHGLRQSGAALHPPCIAKTDREGKNKRNPPKEHSLSTVPSVPLHPLAAPVCARESQLCSEGPCAVSRCGRGRPSTGSSVPVHGPAGRKRRRRMAAIWCSVGVAFACCSVSL